MAKITLTADGAVLKELPLHKERVTIGRRSNNDLVIDHVAISGEHAVIVTQIKDFFIEDLNSTNGTQVNGQRIKKQFLNNNDTIELGPFKIRFFDGTNIKGAGNARGLEAVPKREEDPFADLPALDDDVGSKQIAIIKVMDGPSAGKEITLTKPLTTIGRPGTQVAVLTRRGPGYYITHVEGRSFPLINGDTIGANARLLKYGDVIDLSGTRMTFMRLG